MATTTTSHTRCQPRDKQDEDMQFARFEERVEFIRNALRSDVPDGTERLIRYMGDMHPDAHLHKDLEYVCHNSDKKELMIAKIYVHYYSEKFNTEELCVGEFCKAHVPCLLGNGDEPCILF